MEGALGTRVSAGETLVSPPVSLCEEWGDPCVPSSVTVSVGNSLPLLREDTRVSPRDWGLSHSDTGGGMMVSPLPH